MYSFSDQTQHFLPSFLPPSPPVDALFSMARLPSCPPFSAQTLPLCTRSIFSLFQSCNFLCLPQFLTDKKLFCKALYAKAKRKWKSLMSCRGRLILPDTEIVINSFSKIML